MTTIHEAGLFAGQTPIALEGVAIDVRMTDRCADVTVSQRYVNREDRPIEAVYLFPLEEGSAVCGFSARVGDRDVVGRVEEREAAFDAYDDAMAAGHGAFLLD